MKKEEFYYDSRDEKSKIHAIRWIPDTEPKAIVQIIHGMQEYVDRYDEFARFLADKGILVVGEDHLGHGGSSAKEDLGYFCKDDPATVVVRDVHRLKKLTQEQYPGIPIVLLGHSMGSFILRNYLFMYGTGIQGAIVMGTGSQPGIVLGMGKLITKVVGAFHGGDRYVSKFVANMAFGTYLKRIKNPRTVVDWLSVNEENVDKYVADELCGVPFTLNGFHTLFTFISRAQKGKNLKKIPKNLPIHLIAGEEDPVGAYGEAVLNLSETYQKLGLKVTDRLVSGSRHEILNEDNRQEIYEELYSFVESVC